MNEEIIKRALEKYGLGGAEYVLVKNKEKKLVCEVKFSGCKAALKKMPGSPERTAFIARAADFLNRAGAKVAPIIAAPEGELFVNIKEATFILSQWIDGKQPEYDRHLKNILESMAIFHRSSKGFQINRGESVRLHLGNWPNTFLKKGEKLKQIKVIAHETQSDAFSKKILKYVDYFIEAAFFTEKKLKQSFYSEWVKQVEKELCLCHQDFTPKNLRFSSGELYAYDIDSITIDLPARDIRKLTNKLMKKKGWDINLLNRIYTLYRGYNSISDREWQVVLIDLYFPHLFWGIATKYYYGRASDWSKNKFMKKLDEMISVELAKEKILADLI